MASKNRKTDDLTSLPVCSEEGCSFLVLKRTNYCRVHTNWEKADPKSKIDPSGKKICALKRCTNHAQRKSELCKTHNRFKLCKTENCPKRALRYDEFCSDHGGGKRCSIVGCDNIVRSKGLCIGHGGGKRCNVAECPNSAVGSTGICKAHGAGKIIKETKPDQPPQEAIPPKSIPIMERLRIISAQRALEKEKESICKERGCQRLVMEKSKYCEIHSRKREAKRRRSSVSTNSEQQNEEDQPDIKKCKVVNCNGVALNKNLLCTTHTRGQACQIEACDRRAMRFGKFCSDHCGFKSLISPSTGVEIRHANSSINIPSTFAQQICFGSGYGVICENRNIDIELFLKNAAKNLVAMPATRIF